jgi:hypothetical protein
MISHNVKYLGKDKIKQLLKDNGVSDSGREYDVTALAESLQSKQETQHNNFMASDQAEEMEYNSIFPPKPPVNFTKSNAKHEKVKITFTFKNAIWNELTCTSKQFWSDRFYL